MATKRGTKQDAEEAIADASAAVSAAAARVNVAGAGAGADDEFEVTLRNAFTGELFGVKFQSGSGRTRDGKRAHACLEIPGTTVTKGGKPAWPDDVEELSPASPAAAAKK